MKLANRSAPGGPGIPARWTSSAKTGVGTAFSDKNRVWFTLSHGILNEICHPHIDQACIRDMGFIVTDGADFFSEEKRDADSDVQWLTDGVPAFQMVNSCRGGRYRIEKQVVTDPHRDTVLQKVHFVSQQGDAGLKIHLADLPSQSLPEGKQIKFTFYWPDASHWEGNDLMVRIATWRRGNFVPAERNGANGK
jgi:glucoamylase